MNRPLFIPVILGTVRKGRASEAVAKFVFEQVKKHEGVEREVIEMRDASGRNLDWFWNNWFFSNHYIDLAVASVTRAGGGYTVVLNNVGGMAAPVDLRLRYADGSTETLHQTPAIWQADPRRATVRVATGKVLQSLELDGGIFMDARPADNRWAAGR